MGLQLSQSSLVNIQSGGVFDIQGDRSILIGTFGGSIVNAGTFRKSPGNFTSNIPVGFTNSALGVVDVIDGTLALNSTFSHAATALVTGGDTLDLSGASITTLAGDVAPGGASGVDTLEIEMAAATLAPAERLRRR